MTNRMALHFGLVLLTVWCGGCIYIEPLVSPKRVVDRHGVLLELSDGRTVRVPGVSELNQSTPFLDAAIKRGVEVNGDRLIGQMKIWHWCGNDPIRYHLARVDLGNLAIYVGEGTPTASLGDHPPTRSRRRAMLEYGWNVDGYYRFKRWQAAE